MGLVSLYHNILIPRQHNKSFTLCVCMCVCEEHKIQVTRTLLFYAKLNI